MQFYLFFMLKICQENLFLTVVFYVFRILLLKIQNKNIFLQKYILILIVHIFNRFNYQVLTRIHHYSSDTRVTKQVVKKYHPEEKTRQFVGYV